MQSKKIELVCEYCGVKANHLTQMREYGKNFDEDKFNPMAEIATAVEGVCQNCGYEGNVYPVRDLTIRILVC